MLLGSRYGFPLFSRKPVRDHLLPDALRVSAQSPIASVLERVASRSEETFYDDVLLVDEQGSFLGMIFTRTLVQLQHRFLRENIGRLEEKQREINAKNSLMFATAYYLVADAKEKCVRYAAAGHPFPLHLRRVPGIVERLGVKDNSRGPALGLFEEPVYLSGQRELDAGDVVLFFTDGLFEAINEANMEFGEARLAATVAEWRNQPLQRLLDEVVSEVERFTGTRKFGDDVCVLAMELKP
jgi:serine phosphatase RsbU (regulator of sigma subunit)